MLSELPIGEKNSIQAIKRCSLGNQERLTMFVGNIYTVHSNDKLVCS